MNIDAMEAAAKAATPGPWESVGGAYIYTPVGAANADGVEADGDDGWHVAECSSETPSFVDGVPVYMRASEARANAEFIAEANPRAVLDLIAEHRAALSENKHLRAEIAAILEKVDVMSNYIGELHSAAFNAALDAMTEDAERMGMEYSRASVWTANTEIQGRP